MENFIGIEQDEEDIIKTILESKEFDFRDSFSQQGNEDEKLCFLLFFSENVYEKTSKTLRKR